MCRKGILLGWILSGLILIGCSSEVSKLEGEIINDEAFLSAKSTCEVLESFMQERLGGSSRNLQKCIEDTFNKDGAEICEKKGYAVQSTSCMEARKRVLQRISAYMANPPKKASK